MSAPPRLMEDLGKYAPPARVRGDSLLWLCRIAARNLRVLSAVPLAAAGIAALIVWLWPITYTSTVSFSATGSSASQLSSLAAQFGVALPTSDIQASPDFYVAVAGSNPVLIPVVTHVYSIPQGSDSARGDLTVLLGASGSSRGDRIRSALQKLDKQVKTASDPASGIVTVQVQTRNPSLSYQIAQGIEQGILEVNTRLRQEQAKAELEFTEQRLGVSQGELRHAEDALQSFLARNRLYQSDPALLFQSQRLQRDLTTAQQVYQALVQAYEQERVDAVRNTPVVSFVEHAGEPPFSDDRRWVLKISVGFVLGALFAIGLVAVREYIGHRMEAGDPALSDLDVSAPRIHALLRRVAASPTR